MAKSKRTDLERVLAAMLGAAEVDDLDSKSNEWRSAMIEARELLCDQSGDPEKVYYVDGSEVRKLENIKTRLYDMTKMTADERRDLAHRLGLVLDSLVETD